MIDLLRRKIEGYVIRKVVGRMVEATRKTPEAFTIIRLVAKAEDSQPSTATGISYGVTLDLPGGAMLGEMVVNPDPGDEIEAMEELTFADFGRPVEDPALRERLLHLLRKEATLSFERPLDDPPQMAYEKGKLDVTWRRP